MKVIVKDQDGEITTLEAPVLRYGTGDTVDIFIVTEVIKHSDKEDEHKTLAMFRNWVTVDIAYD